MAVADLEQMQVHGAGIGMREHQGSACAARGADGAEQVAPRTTLVTRGSRTRAALSPHPGQRALLADPALVLPPQLQRLVAGVRRQGCFHEGGEVALKDACAAAS